MFKIVLQLRDPQPLPNLSDNVPHKFTSHTNIWPPNSRFSLWGQQLMLRYRPMSIIIIFIYIYSLFPVPSLMITPSILGVPIFTLRTWEEYFRLWNVLSGACSNGHWTMSVIKSYVQLSPAFSYLSHILDVLPNARNSKVLYHFFFFLCTLPCTMLYFNKVAGIIPV